MNGLTHLGRPLVGVLFYGCVGYLLSFHAPAVRNFYANLASTSALQPAWLKRLQASSTALLIYRVTGAICFLAAFAMILLIFKPGLAHRNQ